MKYARIINHSAVDVRDESPEGYFTPNLVEEFVQVPDQVENGWTLTNGHWQAPLPPEPAPEPEPIETPLEVIPVAFKLLFKPEERIAINEARKTDPMLQDAFSILDDPRLTAVNMRLNSTKDLVKYCALKGYIPTNRVDEILSGIAV